MNNWNNWYEMSQKQSFWNALFKILVLVLLAGILFSLSSISHSLRKGGSKGPDGMRIEQMKKNDTKNHGWFWDDNEDNEHEIKNDKPNISGKEVKIPEDAKLPVAKEEKTTATGTKVEAKKGWWFFGNDDTKEVKVHSTGSTITASTKPDAENRYNFRCDGGNLIKIYEGKYILKGQKSSLEPGKIALEDPQTGRIHFLGKKEDANGVAIYDKTVEVQEKDANVLYTYAYSSLANGTASFTKNGKDIYTNCNLVR